MSWLLLALASAGFLGGYEVARKAAVRENAILPVLLVANVGGFAVLLVGVSAAALHPTIGSRLGISLTPLTFSEHLAVLFKASLVTLSWVLAYVAVKHLPISVAAPLRSLSPVITLLGAVIIFREAPDAMKWVGMGVIFSGYLGFAWLGPKEGINYAQNRWILLLLAGTAVGAVSGLYDKFLLQHLVLPPTTLQFWFCAYNVVVQGALVRILWYPRRSEAPFRFSPVIPLVGVLLVVADQFYFRSLSDKDALVSVVALVRRCSVVLSFTLGGVLFGEQLLKRKAIFLFVIVAGLTLLFV